MSFALRSPKGEQQAKDEHVFLPEGDGVTDAYSALAAMIACRRRVQPGVPDSAPLFVLPGGAAYRVRHAYALFRLSGQRLGIPWEQLGAQSGRIGGATDLFASGASPAVMQVAGRWVRPAIEPTTVDCYSCLPFSLWLKGPHMRPTSHDNSPRA